MPTYFLSPQAQDSLRGVRAYTLKHYGEKQARVYLKLLRDGMREAAKRPNTAGMPRDEIKKGYYSIFAGRHTIYYRIRTSHIDIIHVLHQSMDPMRHL